jgi:hemerythrin-like domain-containing protein
MRLTEALSQDHRVIEQVLRCLLEMSACGCTTAEIDVASAEAAVEFLRTFADTCHHKKEEDVLFPALARAGFGPEGGPVAVMLEEHELGRKYLGRIDAALQAARNRAPDAAGAFADAVRAYVDLLTQHISKEDHILFPMADHAIQGSELAAVRAGFDRAEDALDHGRLHARMIGIADALGVRYGVKRADSPGAFKGCVHHHAGT